MDIIDRRTRSSVMAKVRSTNTLPEVCLRKALFAHGYRFRLHGKNLPGTPDIILAKYRAVIFVNGCFWHWHGCARSRMPSSNVDYWTQKIIRNKLRDKRNRKRLATLKWRVLVVWECALKPSRLRKAVATAERWLNSSRSYSSIG
jgi:DNA mismatch endonuclease (patch repair protein)